MKDRVGSFSFFLLKIYFGGEWGWIDGRLDSVELRPSQSRQAEAGVLARLSLAISMVGIPMTSSYSHYLVQIILSQVDV